MLAIIETSNRAAKRMRSILEHTSPSDFIPDYPAASSTVIGGRLSIESPAIEQHFNNWASSDVARNYSQQITDLLTDMSRNSLSQDFNPIVLDHRIREQLVGRLLQGGLCPGL